MSRDRKVSQVLMAASIHGQRRASALTMAARENESDRIDPGSILCQRFVDGLRKFLSAVVVQQQEQPFGLASDRFAPLEGRCQKALNFRDSMLEPAHRSRSQGLSLLLDQGGDVGRVFYLRFPIVAAAVARDLCLTVENADG